MIHSGGTVLFPLLPHFQLPEPPRIKREKPRAGIKYKCKQCGHQAETRGTENARVETRAGGMKVYLLICSSCGEEIEVLIQAGNATSRVSLFRPS
jgi:transcription elongation factor Elf1